MATDSLKQNSQKVKTDRPPKDDYKSGERRPYDRRSGTGRPAFGNNFKKEGHGHGNVGRFSNEDDYVKSGKNIAKANEKREKAELATGEKPVEGAPNEKAPPEPIITLEEYVKSTGAKFGLTEEKVEEKKDNAVKAVVDPELKPIQSSKVPQEELVNKKKKNIEGSLHVQASNLIESLPQVAAGDNKGPKVTKKPTRKEFNDNDFPALGK